MKRTIDKTERRRQLQMDYNEEHNLIPTALKKSKDIYFVSLESEEKTLDYNQIKFRLDSVFTEFPLNKFENLSVINKQSFTFLNPDSNLVFVLSEDEVFIKKIVTFIRAIDTNFSLYSSEIITKIKGIDIEDLMRLDIHVPVSNYFDNYSQKNKYLQNKFESIFSRFKIIKRF